MLKDTGRYEESLSYSTEYLRLVRKYPNKFNEAAALQDIGIIHYKLADYDLALSYYKQSLELYQQLNISIGANLVLNNIAIIYYAQGDYDASLETFHQIYRIFKKENEVKHMSTALTNIAEVNRIKGDFEASLEANFKALNLIDSMGSTTRQHIIYNNIGAIYFTQGNYEESEKFHEKALEIRKKMDARDIIGYSMNNLAILYELTAREAKAQAYFQEALSIFEEIGDKDGEATVLHNLGGMALGQEKWSEAELDFRKAIALRAEIGEQYGLAESFEKMSELMSTQGQLDSALLYNQQAKTIADSLGSLTLILGIYETQSALLEQKGDFQGALIAYKAFKKTNDSLFTTESKSLLAEFQQQYKTKEQRQRIELLEQKEQNQRLWLIGLIVCIVLLAVIVFLITNRYRLKNRSHDQLQQAYRELSNTQQQLIQAEKMASLGQLTAGIAHEIKNPLNIVNNFAQLSVELAEELETEFRKNIQHMAEDEAGVIKEILEDLKLNAEAINRQGQRADGIVTSMMEHASGAERERMKVKFNQLIKGAGELGYRGCLGKAKDVSIQIEEHYDESIDAVTLVPQDISRVIINLFNNACDAMSEKRQELGKNYQPMIKVQTQKLDEQVEIRIQDNGKGISPEIQEKIFEPFFTTKTPEQGSTGLGLSIVHDIVKQGHNGSLQIESEAGAFTTMIIRVPIG